MRVTIRSITKSCKTCQINKRRNIKYGHLLAKLVTSTPWECLCVNLIGPYTIKGKESLQIDFVALTMIDPASSWFEIMELPLVRRLRTTNVNGKELSLYYIRQFKLHLEHLCDSYGIKRKPTTVKNPQANALLERVHQVLGQMLRTSELDMAV
jgi:hypothetical protein